MNRVVVSRARCSASSRCFAEPGSHEAPAFGTAPALQRTASRCAASGERRAQTKKPALPPAFVARLSALARVSSMRGFERRLLLPRDRAFHRGLHLFKGADLDLPHAFPRDAELAR